MNTKKKMTTLATSAATLVLAGVILTTDLVSMSNTHELSFGFLVIGVLGGLAVSEYRWGTPRRITGIGLRRFPRQHFPA